MQDRNILSYNTFINKLCTLPIYFDEYLVYRVEVNNNYYSTQVIMRNMFLLKLFFSNTQFPMN